MRIKNHLKFGGLGRALSRAASQLARPRLGDRDERMLKDLGISPAQADWAATHRVPR
jgi:uncharacterized protein YjiS (DUF1127 family)